MSVDRKFFDRPSLEIAIFGLLLILYLPLLLHWIDGWLSLTKRISPARTPHDNPTWIWCRRFPRLRPVPARPLPPHKSFEKMPASG